MDTSLTMNVRIYAYCRFVYICIVLFVCSVYVIVSYIPEFV